MIPKKHALKALAAAALFSMAAVAGAQDKEPVQMAVIDPMTGTFANMGLSQLAFFNYEAKRLNAAGGINGHPLEIVDLDNKTDPQVTSVQLQKAIDRGIRFIAQANGSSVASSLISAVDKYNRRNPDNPVLYFNYGAVDPVFTQEGCSFWHFRFDANADMKMTAVTDWIQDQPDIKKVFLLNMDYQFGRSVSATAKEMLGEKRPDIEIVGDVFIPMGKVKDFAPYITQIKSADADAIITGNWGPDMSLFTKAAADFGLDIPFLTYYASLPGTPANIGKGGVGITYLAGIWDGDFDDPELLKRQEEMKAESGYDYGFVQVMYLLDMFKAAAEKADSIDPVNVAFALEDLSYDSPYGKATMRGKDHQLLAPMFVSVFSDNMPVSIENTDHLNFKSIQKIAAEDVADETVCEMKRPAR